MPLVASARGKNWFVKIPGEVCDRYGFAVASYVVIPETFTCSSASQPMARLRPGTLVKATLKVG